MAYDLQGGFENAADLVQEDGVGVSVGAQLGEHGHHACFELLEGLDRLRRALIRQRRVLLSPAH